MRCFSRVLRIVRLAVLLSGGLACLAQNASPGAQTYRISGRVVDARSGAALTRCSVQIVNVKNSHQSRMVNSGDDGGFVFEGLPQGKYSLSAYRHGYLRQNYEEHGNFSTAIAAGPDLVSENLIFKLVAESVIEGTVTDEAAEPVRGAQVRLYEDQDSDGNRATRAVKNAITDDRGEYELIGLRRGAYFLLVTAQPWYTQRGGSEGGEPSAQTKALDVVYPTTFYPGATTEEAADPIPVQGGERLKIDVTLNAQPAMRLHLSAAQTSPKGQLMVMFSHSLFGQVEYLQTGFETLPDGSMEISGILPGHYEVTLNRSGPESGNVGLAESKHLSVDLSTGMTELSEEGSSIPVAVTGRVTSDAGKLPPGSLMALFTKRREQAAAAQVDSDGNFSFPVLPGTYELISQIDGMYMAVIKVRGATCTGRTLTVKAGDSPRLDIVAGNGFGEIEGTALRGEKPASTVMVLLAPEDPKNNKALFWRDQSDSDGTFGMATIIPGRYHLLAIERGWELEWANPDVLRAFLDKSVPVEVRAGDHLKRSVQVQAR